MLRQYELGLVFNPDLSEEQLEAQFVRIGQTIDAHEGQILHLDRWGRRRLAYPIGRHRDGYYAFIDLQMESLAVRDIERMLLVQEEVMRYLITYIDPRAQAERQRRQELEAQRAALAAQRAEAAAAHASELAAAQANGEVPVAQEYEPVAAATEPEAEALSDAAAPEEPATPEAEAEPEPAE